MEPLVTVVVTTHNRRDDLRTALRSVVAQTVAPELVVIDDGSTDGTAEMVEAEFPSAQLHRSEIPLGCIAQRNVGARLARGAVIVSIDDDAEFPSPDSIEQTLADFDHPRVGAVAMPGIDVRHSPEVLQRAPSEEGVWVTPSYWGTAHAVRRDLFVALDGYEEDLREMFEEVDFCLRLLDAGYVTRLGRADPLHHYESPKRVHARKVRFVWRNNISHAWRNVPLPYTPVRVAKVTVAGILYGLRHHQLRAVASGLLQGLREAPALLRRRRAVSRATYRLDHALRKRGPLQLSEIEHRLAPARPAANGHD